MILRFGPFLYELVTGHNCTALKMSEGTWFEPSDLLTSGEFNGSCNQRYYWRYSEITGDKLGLWCETKTFNGCMGVPYE